MIQNPTILQKGGAETCVGTINISLFDQIHYFDGSNYGVVNRGETKTISVAVGSIIAAIDATDGGNRLTGGLTELYTHSSKFGYIGIFEVTGDFAYP